MKRLIEAIVRVGFVTAWRLAGAPTSFAPSGWKATTEGVVRPPSALGITTGWPPSITHTTELVVPRSMPMILLWLLMGVRAPFPNAVPARLADVSLFPRPTCVRSGPRQTGRARAGLPIRQR